MNRLAPPRPLLAAALLACCIHLPAAAQAPANPAPAAAGTSCKNPGEMVPSQLYGLWQLVLWTQDGQASEAAPSSRGAVLFQPHPEYPGSVRGTLKRSGDGNDLEALVSGDVTQGGEFNLDESADGVAMDAVWEGSVPPTACGQELRGTRRSAQGTARPEPVMNFVLKKASGWR